MTHADEPAAGEDRALRVFVAMPGSKMGADAAWDDPDQIKRRLYGKVRESLEAKLSRRVELIVEKDKHQPGSIYRSMYSEAWIADVYLVDLTGANANVYLELGVRWAMSDGVTVLIAQNPAKLPFNVVATRAQPYSSDPDDLENSIERIVRAVLEGMDAKKRGRTDSPVRDGADFVTVPAARISELESELEAVQRRYGENYLEAASKAPTLRVKIDLLRRAVEVNPLTPEGHFQLGRALRESGDADQEAIRHLQEASNLAPSTPRYWRELGVALSKSGELDAALRALERCIELDPDDVDAISISGGAKRRLALKDGIENVDWETLRDSKDDYERASRIAPRDVYPLLNVARTELLLSKVDPSVVTDAQDRFRKALPLCQFELQFAQEEVERQANDTERLIEAGYRYFDYADCLLFSGQPQEGAAVYAAAVTYLPPELRPDVLRSVAKTLGDIAGLAALDADTGEAVADAIRIVSEGSS
jgi:tetratricopeptide (TPR) repeat protein